MRRPRLQKCLKRQKKRSFCGRLTKKTVQWFEDFLDTYYLVDWQHDKNGCITKKEEEGDSWFINQVYQSNEDEGVVNFATLYVSNFRISDIENFRFSNCHVHFFFICQFSRVVKKYYIRSAATSSQRNQEVIY